MIRVGHVTISVCCELPYASTGQSALGRRHANSARPGWSDTRRRIGGSFTRTSQAFARFNPEIRTGAAELLEHSVMNTDDIEVRCEATQERRSHVPCARCVVPGRRFACAP